MYILHMQYTLAIHTMYKAILVLALLTDRPKVGMLFLRKHATLGMQVSVLREPMACSRRTVGPDVKNPPKILPATV